MKTTGKSFLVVFIGVLSLLIAGGIGYAAVSGPCADCHTMHNSQGGEYEALEDDGSTLKADPYAHLTKSSCIGCHSVASGIGPAVNMTYATTGADVSAGGSFAVWSTNTDDTKVHNVAMTGLTITPDTNNTSAGNGVPGLGVENMNILVGGSADPADLTCAGAYGCHGKVTDAAITDSDAGVRGFHHGSNAYRYLNIAGTGSDVDGLGSSDWEAGGAGATNHNVYSASTTVGINKLCANCHPDFHGTANTKPGSSWVRHPTDNLFGDTDWTLASVTTDYKGNPFAFADGHTVTTGAAYAATDTGASVACVSCHRAHGTPYADLLRWDYSGQVAGGGYVAGCLGCHYKQQ